MERKAPSPLRFAAALQKRERSILSMFIPAREFLVPFPRALDDGIQRLKFWPPAELAFDFFRGRDQTRRVAWSPRFFHHWNWMSGNAAATLNHLAHTRTTTSAKVVKRARRRRQCKNVRISQIADVNVVANAGAIRRVVIGSKDLDLFFPPKRDLQYIRN